MITEHFILAQASSIDRDSNTLSVFQLMEDLTIQTTSGQMHLPAQAILVVKREGEKGRIDTKFAMKIINPKQQEVMNQVFSIRMEESHRRSRLRVNFGIPINMSGEYAIMIESSEHPTMNARFSFLANMVRPEPQEQLPTQ